MNPVIFHVDVNSAFLSWSAVKLLKEKPGSVDLRTIPSAVGGDVKTRHGVITAKSIPAKKYGIQTGEPVVTALKKCPNLYLVKSDFQTYREYSRAFISILRRYTDLIQQVSIDEAYMDVTGCARSFSASGTGDQEFPLDLAAEIRQTIRRELGFTVNIGISTNKLLAKMASDFKKPDLTHTLYPSEIREKLWPLPIESLHGCGSSTAQHLRSLGIRTIGEAAEADLSILCNHLGEKAGTYISASARGIGSTRVHPEREEAKSYSNETTTSSDITTENYDTDVPRILKNLSESVSRRLKRDGFYASTIGIMVKTDDFRRLSRQMTLPRSVHDSKEIFECASTLMQQLVFGSDGLFTQGAHLRLIGVSAAHLDRGEYRQMILSDLIGP